MLKIENLSITYQDTGIKVIDDLSLSLPKGKIVAIMGPSGCGKTTLLRAINNLFSPGDVSMVGNIKFSRTITIRTVFQEPRLLPWKNISDNVGLGISGNSDSRNSLIRENMKMVGLEGLDTMFPNQISLGMQQRVNLARAMITKPDLLLMDEPFSALDGKIKSKIINDYKIIIGKEKMTTIFVTHNIKEAEEMSDYIIFLGKNFVGKKRSQNTNNFVDLE